MRAPLRVLAAATASVLVLLSMTRPGSACSTPPCHGATAHLLPSEGATVPANALGIVVFPGVSMVDAQPAIALVKTLDGKSAPVAFDTIEPVAGEKTKILVPAGGLEVGAKYDVTVGSTCEGARSATTSFTVGTAAPKPTSLGTLVTSNPGVFDISVSSSELCTQSILAAQSQVEVTLDPEAAPWQSLLRYETIVDGVRWAARANATEITHPAGSWKGIRKDVLFAPCAGPARGGLSLGTHRVQMRAYLPGDAVPSVETAPVDVVLSCATNGSRYGPGGSRGTHGVPVVIPSSSADSSSTSTGCSAGSPSGSNAATTLGVALGLCLAAVARRKRS